MTAGTALHGTHLPLSTIAYALTMVGARKQSISALQLMKDRAIGSYRTAWLLLHRVRLVLDERPIRRAPNRQIEVASPLVEHGDGVRQANADTRTTALALAIARWSRAPSRTPRGQRIRMRAPAEDPDVIEFFCAVELDENDVKPRHSLLAATLEANFSVWLNGTFHGVTQRYMSSYLREFVFRFNRRRHERVLPAIAARRVLRSNRHCQRDVIEGAARQSPLSPT